jgi:hypothetical protein
LQPLRAQERRAASEERIFEWLCGLREETKPIAADANRIVAKSSERGELPRGAGWRVRTTFLDVDPIEEPGRIVGQTHDDRRSRNVAGAHRTDMLRSRPDRPGPRSMKNLSVCNVAPPLGGLDRGKHAVTRGARRESLHSQGTRLHAFGRCPAREPSARSREWCSWRSCRAIASLFPFAAFVTREIVCRPV